MARKQTLIKDPSECVFGQTDGTFARCFLASCDAMSVLTTSIALWPWNVSRYREVAPFLPNQSMKPMAPARYFATLLATNAAHGLSLSR